MSDTTKPATPAEVLRAHVEAILEMCRGGLFHPSDATSIRECAEHLRVDADEIEREACLCCGWAKAECDVRRRPDEDDIECCPDCDHDHAAPVKP